MPPPSETATQNSPLAPSVEKAYYRKCIALKRRLNEVEAANDDAKIRRVRLDRAIMKMRLERAFLLDELRKRMENNIEGSDGSADEGMATPPADRPHRDKRRRQQPAAQSAAAAANASTSTAAAGDAAAPSESEKPDAAASAPAEAAPAQTSTPADSALPHPRGSPHGAPVGLPSNPSEGSGQVNGTEGSAVDREAGAVGEPVGAGPTIREDANGERKVVSPSAARSADVD